MTQGQFIAYLTLRDEARHFGSLAGSEHATAAGRDDWTDEDERVARDAERDYILSRTKER